MESASNITFNVLFPKYAALAKADRFQTNESIENYIKNQLPLQVEVVKKLQTTFSSFLNQYSNLIVKRPQITNLSYSLASKATDLLEKLFKQLELKCQKQNKQNLSSAFQQLNPRRGIQSFRSSMKQLEDLIREKYINNSGIPREQQEKVAQLLYTILQIYHFVKSDLVTIGSKHQLEHGKVCDLAFNNRTIEGNQFFQLTYVDEGFKDYINSIVQKRCRPFYHKKDFFSSKIKEVMREAEGRLDSRTQPSPLIFIESVLSKQKHRITKLVVPLVQNILKNFTDIPEEAGCRQITERVESLKRKFMQVKNNSYYIDIIRGDFTKKYKMELTKLENLYYLSNIEKYLQDVMEFVDELLKLEESIIQNRKNFKQTLSSKVQSELYQICQIQAGSRERLSGILSFYFTQLENLLYLVENNSENSYSQQQMPNRYAQKTEEKENYLQQAKRNRQEQQRKIQEEKRRRIQREAEQRKIKEEQRKAAEEARKIREMEEQQKRKEKVAKQKAQRQKFEEQNRKKAQQERKKRAQQMEKRQKQLEEKKRQDQQRKKVEQKQKKEIQEQRRKQDEQKRKKQDLERKKRMEQQEKIKKSEQEKKKAEIQKKKKEEQERLKNQEQQRKKREAQDKKKRDEDEKRKKQEEDKKKKQLEQKKRKQDEQRKRKEQQDRKLKQAEQKKKKQADQKRRKQEEQRLKKQAEDKKKRDEDERRRKQEEDRKKKQEEDRKKKEADDKKKKQEEQRKRKEQQDRKLKQAEQKKKKQAEDKKKKEQQQLRKKNEEEKRKREEAERLQAEEKRKKEQKRIQQQKRKKKQEQDKRKKQDQQRKRKEEEDRKQKQAEQKRKKDEEAKRKLEQQKRKKEEEENKRKAQQQKKKKQALEKEQKQKQLKKKQQQQAKNKKGGKAQPKKSAINYGELDDELIDQDQEVPKNVGPTKKPTKNQDDQYLQQYDEDFDQFSPDKEDQEEGDGPKTQQLIEEENLKSLNQYMKGTSYARKNKPNLEAFNNRTQYAYLFEEFTQNGKFYIYNDSSISKAIYDFGKELEDQNVPQQNLQLTLETIQQAMAEEHMKSLNQQEVPEETRLIFPLSFNNDLNIYLVEVLRSQQYIIIVFKEEPPKKQDFQYKLSSFVQAFRHLYGIQQPQLISIVVPPETKAVLQTFDKELPNLLLIFALHYEQEHNMTSPIIINQYTIERFFYILHILQPLYDIIMKEEEKIQDFFGKLNEKYDSGDKLKILFCEADINDEEQQGYDAKISATVHKFKEDFLKSKTAKQQFALVQLINDSEEETVQFRKIAIYFCMTKEDAAKPTLSYFIISSNDQDEQFASKLFEFASDELDDKFERTIYMDYSRHNGLSEYSEWSLCLWPHLVQKRKMNPLQAFRAMTLAMTPYYMAFKALD